MSQLTARELMTRDVIVVRDDWSVEQLKELLLSRSISGAPVVNGAGAFVGVVSLTDLSKNAPSSSAGQEDAHMHDFYVQALRSSVGPELARSMNLVADPEMTVKDIMTPVIFDVDVTASAPEIADKMLTGHIHRVFVTEAGKIVGVITALDMLRIIRDM
ncbi:MAG: CBS domain-containing protein [Polyangiaceae bacterium]